MKPNPIAATVDFDVDGVQHGFMRLPWSRDESAWGNLMIPIAVIKNGNGPTALLTGGNHGDEYEGPIALADLASRLSADDVSGRIIVVPYMNYPAFQAARRVSPIDGLNMNRIFPGRPDGTVTEKIADYFQHTLLPMADYVLDFHSGGRSLDFLPFAACHVLDDKDQQARSVAARNAFGAPYAMTMLEIDATGMYDTAAEELGKVFVTTEIGGGGTATASTTSIAKRGVANFLKHAGILSGALEEMPTVELEMAGSDCFVFSQSRGMVEPVVDLGETVRKGDVLAKIHPVERVGVPPDGCRALMDGILAARHFPGIVGIGDCLAVVASSKPSGR
jgi:N2-acetyl-L-2,4-diaminobutanoate deacetylase